MRLTEISAGDCPEYYRPYLDTLGDASNLVELMKSQMGNFPQFIRSIPEDKLHFRYDVGKWTVAEVLMHILDTERVFADLTNWLRKHERAGA